ncbi:MAG TPA: VWA domain-containing protein, partial [Planctomycetota bacterium]|nr:VWA domain-containing protein [Planctomycetota bacterium]
AVAVQEWERVLPWIKHQDGDNSISQFAVLGLRAAQRCSVPVPKETWRRAAGWFQRGQRQNGGFGYNTSGSDAHGSMALAGIGGLAITAHMLGDEQFAYNLALRRGLAWMRAHFALDKNPESGSYLYYYLYSLERIGRILDRELLCGQEWYPLGCKQLLAAQLADGSWDDTPGGENPRLATSFALLFLTRATAQLEVELKRGGTGTLLTCAQAAPGARIYVILDASGSMLDDLDGHTKFELARTAVEEVFAGLAPGTQIALRAYGHRKRAVDKGADEDTELLLPMGPLDRAQFVGKLKGLRARGKTPLTRSLRAAAADLGSGASQGPTTVVLLTDGGEDTMPRLDPVAAARELARIPGLKLHVVGFDIQRDDWRQQLLAMAGAARGNYWPAGSADLVRDLRAAVLQMPDGFVLRDAAGAEVKNGSFGDRLQLAEGRYRLETAFGGRAFAADLWINTEATTAVVFAGAQALAVEQGAPGQTLCPGCRKPLPPGAKFCAECGAKVGDR